MRRMEPSRVFPDAAQLQELAQAIRRQGRVLGFSQIGIADIDLQNAEAPLLAWLAAGHHGAMEYMQRHGLKRARPAELVPGTQRVITARMDYLPRHAAPSWVEDETRRLDDAKAATVSLYARGRDYHRVLRQRLQQLADFIAARVDPGVVRVFTDSAPVLEVELATRAGLGWRGKHTLLLNREGGSMFFLGEIFIGLPLPVDAPVTAHCGSCTRCIAICPTQAILGPGELDARRCISYLTIEHPGPIPVDLRPLLGNRIYGCDDCQLVCPWNRHARASGLPDFDVRNGLDSAGLAELFAWTPTQFRDRLAGSPILRIGHERWLRNLAVGLGNAQAGPATVAALRSRADHESALVREHVRWALRRQDVEV